MTPAARRVVQVVVAILVVPVAIAAVVLLVLATTPIGNEWVRRIVVSQANAKLNGDLAIGSLRGNLFSGATVTDVRLTDSSHAPVFTARRVRVDYSLWPALHGRIVIRSLALDTPFVVLDKKPGGVWNFQSLSKPSTTPKSTSSGVTLSELSDVTIRHGRFYYRRPWAPDSTLSARAQDSAVAHALDEHARRRTERVAGGYQRVLDYHDLDARLPSVVPARDGKPFAVQIGALSMLAEPYRPPAIDVRSLVGTLYGSKDSLWWRGAHMALPASNVSGDGKIGFHRSGFLLDLTGAPVALADLRWLDPKLPEQGGGTLRYTMNFHGDTADFAVANANVHYRNASVMGSAAISRVQPVGGKSELLVRGADLTVAKLTTSIIHELAPSVSLKRSGSLDGHVAMSGAPSALQLDADLSFTDVAAGLSHVTARGGIGVEHGMQARGLEIDLRPLQVATLSGVVHSPLAGVLTGNATVSGGSLSAWTVRGDLTHVDRGERSHVIGSGSYQMGSRQIAADATLEPLSLVTAGRFAPRAQLRGSVSGRVHAAGTPRALQLSGTVKSREDGGSLDATYTVNLHGAATRYDVTAVVDALNTYALSRRAPVTRLTGTMSARGMGTTPATINAVVSADLTHSSYDTFTVDRVHARVSADSGLLTVDSLDMLAGGAHARAAGSLGLTDARAGTLQFVASVDSLAALRKWLGSSDTTSVAAASARQRTLLVAARADSARRADAVRIERLALGLPEGVALLVDTLQPLRRDSLAGRFDAAGTLSGNVKALAVDASVRGEGLVARGNSVRRLVATIASRNVRDSFPAIHFDGSADAIQTSGLAFQHAQATGDWRKKELNGSAAIRQDSLVSYALSGTYGQPAAGVHVVRLATLRAAFDTLVWQLVHPAAVRVDHGTIAMDSVDIRSNAGGRLFANGTVPASGPLRLDVAAEGVRIATVLRAMQRDTIAEGVIAVHAHADGSREQPVLAGDASLRSARYDGIRAPDADVAVRYRDLRLAVDATAQDSLGRRVLSGNAVLPFNLGVVCDSASRRIAGPLTADVVMDSLPLAGLPFTSRSFSGLAGVVAGDVHARGTWKAPAYTGRAGVRGGGITLAATGARVADAVLDVSLSADTLRVDSLVARMGGPLRAWGTVDLTNRSRPFVNVSATGTRLRVMDQDRGLVDADAEVFAIGPLDALRVTGQGTMLDGFLALHQIRKDLLRLKAPGDLSFLTVFDTAPARNDSLRKQAARAQHRTVALIVDLGLTVDHGNYYRNRPDANIAYSTGEGEELRLHVDQRSEDAWAVGFVRLTRGVALFRARAFTPARGTLTLVPQTNSPPLLQQVSERMLWEPGRGWLPLQLLSGGEGKSPAIGLESGTIFPMRGRELNGYLTVGRTATSLLQQSGSSLSGSESWSGQLSGESGALAHRQQAATALGMVVHDIGTGATQEFGLDAFVMGPADVPTELVFGKTGGVRGALIEGGRYLTTERYLGGEIRLTSGIPGLRFAQNFGTTYRLDLGVEPRLLFRAPEELGITHPTVRTGVFGLFLTRMWDF